jgi:YVTN family beta-propeller protein
LAWQVCAKWNGLAKIKAGPRSNGITVHPDGKRVFVSNGGEASVSVIDIDQGVKLRDIAVGKLPWGVAIR